MASTPISELIADAGPRLTPTDRRIAEAVLADPTLIAFGTVSDLAGRVGTSRPSVVRFASKLGFGGYTELQDHARSRLSLRLDRPTERIRSDQADVSIREGLSDSLNSVFDAVEGDRLKRLAEPLGSGDRVWIISGETSRAAAHVLASGMSMVRGDIHLVDDHSIGRDLSSASSSDAGVVFDFHRYRKHALIGAEILSKAGATVVAVTDGPLSPLASVADVWCQIDVPAVGPFDSSVPAVAVAELLVAQVARDLHDEATSQIDLVEDLWKTAGTFLEGAG